MIYERICLYCGKEFKTDYSLTMCCSKSCGRKYSAEKPTCPYNVGVVCGDHNCDGCGWNPEVAKARLDKIMGIERRTDE